VKSILLILLFSCIFYTGNSAVLPDTIYWQIYLKGYLIKSFNGKDTNPEFSIDRTKIEKGDKLLVQYFRDTPCASCPTHLAIYDDNKNEVLLVNGKSTLAPLYFDINKLISKWNTESIKFFEGYYWENNSVRHKLLFILKFE
jgi:hypothetical protein